MRILCLCIMFFPVFAMGDDIVPLSTAYNAGIPALKASLLNAPECPDSTINGLPVADMPPANDPYSMPQHAIRLDGALPDATKPCTIELTFIDKGAGIIHASIQLAGERPRSVGPARQGSYTQLNTGTTRSAWFEFAPLNSSTGVTLFIGGLLHLHEVSGALVPFLIVAVGPLKLGASGNSAATEVISCILGHEIGFLVQDCDTPRLEIDRRMVWI